MHMIYDFHSSSKKFLDSTSPLAKNVLGKKKKFIFSTSEKKKQVELCSLAPWFFALTVLE